LPQVRERVREVLQREEAISCGIVTVEILRGAQNEKDFQSLYESLSSLPQIPIDEAVIERAARWGSLLDRKGKSVSTTDLLIASASYKRDHVSYTLTVTSKELLLRSIAKKRELRPEQRSGNRMKRNPSSYVRELIRTDASPGWGIIAPGDDLAFAEVDLLLAAFADMFFVELVWEDLLFHPAIRTFAGKGLQVLELFMTWTVIGIRHGGLLLKIA
jgi:predicted nucleic acid-binding protein